MTSVRIYVEGDTDVPVARKVVEACGLATASPVVLRGCSRVDAELARLRASASRRTPVFVLRDVDPTPPNLKGRRFRQCGSRVLSALGVSNSGPGFRFRLARHEMESWLLADRKAFAKWLGCSITQLPGVSDDELKPSVTIVKLARDPKVKACLRAALVPADGADTQFGPGFEAAIIGFAAGPWSPVRARKNSRSLDHCFRALEGLRASIRS